MESIKAGDENWVDFLYFSLFDFNSQLIFLIFSEWNNSISYFKIIFIDWGLNFNAKYRIKKRYVIIIQYKS
jgi:hypothetical protein